ncbi:MAG TPA: glycosyltransferase family 87 protein [Gemmatimonadales bacterium]|nr:glycosyltransferase family 87 protein [Gemmatimonadales bacterium]
MRQRFPLPRDPWPRFSSERATRSVQLALYALVLLWAAAEIGRSLGRQHAVIFEGYVQVGDLVLSGGDPYSLAINTWPPFFFFIAGGLALLARVSAILALGLWQVGDVLAIWGCCRLSTEMFAASDEPITFWPRDAGHLAFGSSLVIVPFLLTARLFQEHVQHTQINAQVLFLVLLAFRLFGRGRTAQGGLSLAVAASTKAVPVLLVPYLLYKRAWRELGWTLAFLVVLNAALPVLVFGPTRASGAWHTWRTVAGRETADPTPHFMNQSFPAALKRVLTEAGSLRDPLHYAIADWPARAVQTTFVGCAFAAALLLAWRFRRHSRDWTDPRVAAELAILLGAMVVVDPLAWKAHYVVLIVPTTFVWWALRQQGRLAGTWRWAMFWGGAACITLSAPAIVGNHVRDILESLNVILVGAVMLLVLAVSLVDAQTSRETPSPIVL